MTQFERLQFLTDLLLKEYPSDMLQKNPDNEQELLQVYRSLVNVRQPKKAPDGFLEVERGQQSDARLFFALSPLHRQLHSHFCRD